MIRENVQHLVQPLPLQFSLPLELLLANDLSGPSPLGSWSPQELSWRSHHDLAAAPRLPFLFTSLSALLGLLDLQAGTSGR